MLDSLRYIIFSIDSLFLLLNIYCFIYFRVWCGLHFFWGYSFFIVSAAVPEYDVISPYQLDERGLPLHDQRQRRTDEPRENVFYKVLAFGRELDLNLTLNRKLMSPNLVMETRRADGTVSYASVPKNRYYLGHVGSDPHSMVAISDEGGLVCKYTMKQFPSQLQFQSLFKATGVEKNCAKLKR